MKVDILYLEITNQCNFMCKHCQNNSSYNSNCIIEFQEINNIVLYMIKHGLKTINITGGEPTIHPDFAKILISLVQYDIKINVLTNGYFIDRYIEIIKKYKQKIFVQVSLDGYDRDSFYKIRNNYKFNSIIDNIILLKKNGIDVHIKSTLDKDNIAEFKKYVALSQKLKCKIRFNYLNPVGRGKKIKDVCLDYQDIIEFDKSIKDPNERRMIQTINNFFPNKCSVINYKDQIKVVKITSEGEIFPCIGFRDKKFSLGNYKKDGLINMFENMEVLRKSIIDMIKNENCENCRCSEFCKKNCILVCEYMMEVKA